MAGLRATGDELVLLRTGEDKLWKPSTDICFVPTPTPFSIPIKVQGSCGPEFCF